MYSFQDINGKLREPTWLLPTPSVINGEVIIVSQRPLLPRRLM